MSGTGNEYMTGYQPGVVVGAGNPEIEKYRKMWEQDVYRKDSPGEQYAQIFLRHAKPPVGAEVLDLGCGTGRGGLMLALLGGMKVTLVDFARNCLDEDVRNALTTQAHALK